MWRVAQWLEQRQEKLVYRQNGCSKARRLVIAILLFIKYFDLIDPELNKTVH